MRKGNGVVYQKYREAIEFMVKRTGDPFYRKIDFEDAYNEFLVEFMERQKKNRLPDSNFIFRLFLTVLKRLERNYQYSVDPFDFE